MVRLLDYGFEPNGAILSPGPFGSISNYGTPAPAAPGTGTPNNINSSGSHAVHITIPASAIWGGVIVNYALAQSYDELWARAYYRITDLPAQLAVAGNSAVLTRFSTASGGLGDLAFVEVNRTSTGLYWRLRSRDISNNFVNVLSAQPVDLASAWACVELHLIKSTNVVELYINDVLVASLSSANGVDLTNYIWTRVRFGCDRQTNGNNVSLSIDDTAIDDATKIGPIQPVTGVTLSTIADPSAGGTVTITAGGKAYYNNNDLVSLSANAISPYTFDHWTVTNATITQGTVNTAAITIRMGTLNASALAIFVSSVNPTLRLISEPQNAGSINVSPDPPYSVGTNVTITAVGKFSHWIITNATIVSGTATDSSITIQLTGGDATATAVFTGQEFPWLYIVGGLTAGLVVVGIIAITGRRRRTR